MRPPNLKQNYRDGPTGLTVIPVFGGLAGGVYPMPVGLRNPLSKIPGSAHKTNVPSKSSDIIPCPGNT